MRRTALVTGGTRGIGRAISIALKNAGYAVGANYCGNDSVAAQFTEETGIPAFKWSVADYDACAEGVRQVHEQVEAAALADVLGDDIRKQTHFTTVRTTCDSVLWLSQICDELNGRVDG